MAELDEQEDVVFEALVVEAAGVVGASWALGEKKLIGLILNKLSLKILNQVTWEGGP